jgi:nucleoside-diphosphate-sugar epimerase
MRIVVTGSGGRIGRGIYNELVRGRHDVIGIDRYPASLAVSHVGDICDSDVMRRACVGAHAIIHVAALHAPHVGVATQHDFERVNVAGTAAVIEAAREAGIARIVFTSTTALYGAAAREPSWIDEATPPAPLTVYHRTKLAAEQLLRAAAGTTLQVRILRMARCFPEPADVMAVYRLHRGVDARDVAEAHALALVHEGGAHHTWVISGPTPFEPGDLPALGASAPAVLRVRAPALAAAFEARGWRLPLVIDRVYASVLARSELGWTPRFGFEEVLAAYDRRDVDVLPPR